MNASNGDIRLGGCATNINEKCNNNNNNNHPNNNTTTSTIELLLLLDMNILSTLLQRNSKSHSRTKYYQRCQMAVRYIDRTITTTTTTTSTSTTATTKNSSIRTIESISLHDDWNIYYHQTLLPLLHKSSTLLNDSVRSSRTTTHTNDTSPSLSSSLTSTTIMNISSVTPTKESKTQHNNKDDDDDSKQQNIHEILTYQNKKRSNIPNSSTTINNNTDHEILQLLQHIYDTINITTTDSFNDKTSVLNSTTTTGSGTASSCSNDITTVFLLLYRCTYGITNCIQRIEHAYTSCIMEISRGFFLPIITIMIATLSRIHVLLVQWQSTIITQYNTYLQQLLQTFDTSGILHTKNATTGTNNNTFTKIQLLYHQIHHVQQNIIQPMCHNNDHKIQQQKLHQVGDIRNNPLPVPSTPILQQQHRTERTLQSLGLRSMSSTSRTNKTNHRKRKRPSRLPSPPPTTATMPGAAANSVVRSSASIWTMDDNHNSPTVGEKEDVGVAKISKNIHDDDDDIGQVHVSHFHGNSGTYHNTGSDDVIDGGTNSNRYPTVTGRSNEMSLDQNAYAVQQFKKQQQKEDPKRKSNTATTIAATAARTVTKKKKLNSSSNAKKEKKKGMKKKKSDRTGDDFFDELFG